MITEQVRSGNLASNDIRRTAEFLQKAFGWSIAVSGDNILLDESINGFSGGIYTVKDGQPYFVTIYIAVENIHDAVKMVERMGGVIVEPPFWHKDGSQLCYFTEPSGITHSLIQPKDRLS